MKQNILMLFGVGDIFCSKESHRFLKAGEQIQANARKLILENKKGYFGFVNVLEHNDSNDRVDPFEKVQPSRVINIRQFNQSTISKENIMMVRSSDDDKQQNMFGADQFSFLLPPRDYNIFICGIDINGTFKDTIDSLISEGYAITVYSDVIKPYSKDTIEYLINKSKVRENHVRFGKS